MFRDLFIWRSGTALAYVSCVIEAQWGQLMRWTMTCIMVGMLMAVTDTASTFLHKRYACV